MTDNDLVPFHIWAKNAMEEAQSRAQAMMAMMRGVEHKSEAQIFVNQLGWLLATHATLLNVLATEARDRYESDVKATKAKADDYPQLRMYVFQMIDYQTYAFGLSEAGAREGGAISDAAKCIGFH